MTTSSIVVVIATIGLALAACGSSPSGPSVAALSGSWTGPGSNSLGRHTLSLKITQNGSALSGTAATKAVDAADGSCSSCHMNKMGTLTGTINGSTVALDIVFPSGNAAEPTPICSATLTLTATLITPSQLAGPYTGGDTCEGAWTSATVTLNKQ